MASSRARQRARDSLTEEQEESAGYEDGDHHRSTAALAHDDVGHQAGGQGDGDRLHELKRGDERAAGIEQCLDAALPVGPVAAWRNRWRLISPALASTVAAPAITRSETTAIAIRDQLSPLTGPMPPADPPHALLR